jgi:hypothetical protein
MIVSINEIIENQVHDGMQKWSGESFGAFNRVSDGMDMQSSNRRRFRSKNRNSLHFMRFHLQLIENCALKRSLILP